MTLTNNQFATELEDLITDHDAGTITGGQFVTSLTAALDEWIGVNYSNAALAAKIQTLVTNWHNREQEFREWVGGTETGGPNSDGLYPLTNDLGVTTNVPCPAKLIEDTAGLVISGAIFHKGILANTGLLPASGNNAGDAYLIGDNLWVWIASSWVDVGLFRGPQGLQGIQGPAGSSILSGSAAPVNGTGSNGDFYIETTNSRLYGPKSGGTWPGTYTSLIGPQGVQGIQGTQGIQGIQGLTGNTGPTGPTGPSQAIQYTFSTTITDADPGSGVMRFNNATLGSVTNIYLDDNEQSGSSVTAWLDSFDDSTSTGTKGYLYLKMAGGTKYAVFSITGAVTAAAGYRKVPVSYLNGSALFSNGDTVGVLFSPAGSKGTDGAGAGDVLGPATNTSGYVPTWNGANSKTLANGRAIGVAASTDIPDRAAADTRYHPLLAYTPENPANKGAANGYAPLGSDSKISTTYLPAFVLGAMVYQGTWNASTNSPTIPTAASGNKGYYYKVSVAGTTTIDTINDWAVGDWIVSNGATWDKIDNSEAVSSVAGLVGTISAANLKTAISYGTFTTLNVGNSLYLSSGEFNCASGTYADPHSGVLYDAKFGGPNSGIAVRGASRFNALVNFMAGLSVVGLVTTAASGAGTAGLRIPHGAAPASPVNGDLWSTTSGLFFRLNSTTSQVAFLTDLPSVPAKSSQAQAEAYTDDATYMTPLKSKNQYDSLKGAASDVRMGTNDVKYVTSKALMDSAALVSTTYSATLTLDLSTGYNRGIVTLTGNVTLALPTGLKAGMSGVIPLKQDATGGRTITYATNWKCAGGASTSGALTTAANALDLLTYIVIDATSGSEVIWFSLTKDVK